MSWAHGPYPVNIRLAGPGKFHVDRVCVDHNEPLDHAKSLGQAIAVSASRVGDVPVVIAPIDLARRIPAARMLNRKAAPFGYLWPAYP